MKPCPSCGELALDTAIYCSQCGILLGSGEAKPTPPRSRWYHNVWLVLIALFFVLGPFGLPLVWTNPRFSRTVKLILTAAMALYTIFLIDVTLRMVRAVTTSLGQLNSTLQLY